jgi:hypothetical protein
MQWAILHEEFMSPPAVHSALLVQQSAGDPILSVGPGICSRQVLESISEINRLAGWQQREAKAARLSARELAQKALDIEQRLSADGTMYEPQEFVPERTPACCILGHSRAASLHEKLGQCEYHVKLAEKTTALFRQAALIYLYTIQSGTRPKVGEIKACVARAVRLLKVCAEARLLEYVTWPFCVTGCMIGCETYEEREARIWLSQTLGVLTRYTPEVANQVEIWSAIRNSWRVLDGAGSSDCSLPELMKQIGVGIF